jgi:integrase
VVRGLARCHWTPGAEGVQNQESSEALPGKNATPEARNKKSPRLEKIGPFAEAWSRTQGTRHHARLAALEYKAVAGEANLGQLSPNLGNAMIANWRAHLAPATVAVKRKELARFLRDVIAAGAPAQILKALSKPRNPGPRTTIATPDEITRLFLHASTWMRCWLAITVGHGLRRSSALRLCPANYNADQRTMTYRTKGDAVHTLPVTDELRAYFETVGQVADPNVPLIAIIAGKPVGTDMVYDHWEALKKKATVNPLLRTHDLRRTLAVKLYDATRDLRTVQHALGHKNLITTCGYLEHRDPENIRPILNDLRPKPAHIN